VQDATDKTVTVTTPLLIAIPLYDYTHDINKWRAVVSVNSEDTR